MICDKQIFSFSISTAIQYVLNKAVTPNNYLRAKYFNLSKFDLPWLNQTL